MLEVSQYLSEHTLEELQEEFPIKVSRHPEYSTWVNLDYTAMAYDEEVKNHPIIRECRGLLLDMTTLTPIARGFDRFFNLGELETDFDFNSPYHVYPKLDGSLMILYYAEGEWRWKTRGSATASGTTNVSIPIIGNYTFEWLAWGQVYIHGWDLDSLLTGYTYMFELTSPYNPVVVRYPDVQLRLLAVRDTETGTFLDLSADYAVELFEKFFGSDSVLRPIMTTVQLSDVTDYVENLDWTKEEGVVLVDKHQNRLKVKNKEWCSFHRKVWGITQKKAVELVVENDADLDEICVYFPDIKAIVDETRKDLTFIFETLYDRFKELNKLETQKDFALAVLADEFCKEYSNVLFGMRKLLPKQELMAKIGKRYLDKYTEAP